MKDYFGEWGAELRGGSAAQWSGRRSCERLDEREVLRWSRYAAGAQPSPCPPAATFTLG